MANRSGDDANLHTRGDLNARQIFVAIEIGQLADDAADGNDLFTRLEFFQDAFLRLARAILRHNNDNPDQEEDKRDSNR